MVVAAWASQLITVLQPTTHSVHTTDLQDTISTGHLSTSQHIKHVNSIRTTWLFCVHALISVTGAKGGAISRTWSMQYLYLVVGQPCAWLSLVSLFAGMTGSAHTPYSCPLHGRTILQTLQSYADTASLHQMPLSTTILQEWQKKRGWTSGLLDAVVI